MGKDRGILVFSESFPDEESCIRYYEKERWGDKVVSPFDPTSKVYKCKNHRYKCKNTGKYFDVKTGTLFAGTKLPLRVWFYAIFLVETHKRGISSCQLARDLGITQKTAWYMLKKIREGMSFENESTLSYDVEIDEAFVGGKNKNRHKDKKVKNSQGRSYKDKVPVFGMLERDGKVVAKVVPNTQAGTLLPYIYKYINEGSTIYTDGWDYGELIFSYMPLSVNHENNLYGITYTTPFGEIITISTNGIETFWSHFKRMIIGTYYHVSRKHMQMYVDEFIFRFNTRNISDSERFDLYLRNTA